MARRRKMDEGELAAIVRAAIDDAEGYDQTELSGRRARAIDYYNGVMTDVPSMPGRSSVTSHDMSDAIGWILPSLMRVFTAGDRIAEYEPQGPEDEEAAKQATDYIAYIFDRECDGYRVLYNALFEGLQQGNGLIKHWWDKSVEYETLDFTGLTEEQYILLGADENIEILQKSQDELTGLYDCKLRRTVRTGRLRVVSLPPEEFLIERNALSIEDASFVGHRCSRTRASLIAEGYDREKVMAIPAAGEVETSDEHLARWRHIGGGGAAKNDPLMEEVDIVEAYIRVDYDGDDHPEWRKVVIGGRGGEDCILANDEWGDDVPFTDLCPIPNPHRWDGRSLLDELEDVQKVKTVLIRQTLDNLYLQNLPMIAAPVGGVDNPDHLVNPTLGQVIWEKVPNAVRPLVTPFVASNSMQMLAYLDEVSERRTGVSRTSMALDPEVLQNQTAAGVSAAQSAAYAKIELYARNCAAGLRRMFRCLLKLVVQHQDQPRIIRLREHWVPVDPRSWNANMDCDVSVGLGSGSRDRDLMMLQQIFMQQEKIIGLAGPNNPIVPISKAVRTLRRMVEVAGIKNADSYFGEVTEEQVQQYMAENPQSDPKEKEAQAKIEADQMKAQADLQLQQAKLQADFTMRQQEMAAQLQFQREKSAFELQHTRERAAAEMELKRQEATLNAQLRREEMALEAELTAEANRLNAAVAAKKADTNIKGPN